MRIGGLQQTSMLDYPGLVSAVVFTKGCDFRCPYCHNPGLVQGSSETLDQTRVLDFLIRRRHLLSGVVISGGEPCLQPDLAPFCTALKSMGYAVKLDTNGNSPKVLRRLLAERLVDYVAMDLKGDPRCYAPEICPDPPDPADGAVLESLALLRESGVPHEFRVTAVAPFVNMASFAAILGATRGQAPVFLQKARLQAVLDPGFFEGKGRALDDAELRALQVMAVGRGHECGVRYK